MVRAGNFIENPPRGVSRDLLQLAVTFGEYRDVIHGTTPPWAVQQVLFAVLVPLGRLLGYRPDVPYPGVSERPRPLSQAIELSSLP